MAHSAFGFQSISSPALSNDDIALIESSVEQFGAPLLLLDCDIIRQQYRALKNALPGVTLHYALKPLPHPVVVRNAVGGRRQF
nr:hypothetical protein [Vibrio cidicii]